MMEQKAIYNLAKETLRLDDTLDQANEEIARLRAELAAANERIAQLEASQEWEPVEDGKLSGLTIDMSGSVIWLSDDDDMYLTLPANIRLCRRPQGEGQEEA